MSPRPLAVPPPRQPDDAPPCPACGAPHAQTIRMRLTDGSDAALTYCRRCERRRWTVDGEPAERSEVLARTARR